MNAPSPRADARSRKTVRCASRSRELTDSSLHFYTADVNNTVDSLSGDSPDQRRLRHRARRLPDLRPRRIPPGRPERRLPQLRRRDLHSLDRRKRRLQSHSGEIARGRRRSDRRSFGARRRRLDDSLLTKMFARLVGESFVRNPRRKLLTAAALVVGMAVATATLTVALEVGDRLAREFRSLGANLLVTPQSDTLPARNRRRRLPSRGRRRLSAAKPTSASSRRFSGATIFSASRLFSTFRPA